MNILIFKENYLYFFFSLFARQSFSLHFQACRSNVQAECIYPRKSTKKKRKHATKWITTMPCGHLIEWMLRTASALLLTPNLQVLHLPPLRGKYPKGVGGGADCEHHPRRKRAALSSDSERKCASSTCNIHLVSTPERRKNYPFSSVFFLSFGTFLG